jgi:outer membrane protein, multidrug efflux system
MRNARLATRSAILVGSIALGSACVPALPGETPREASKAVPPSYGSSPAAGGARGQNVGQRKWNEFFIDPQLTALIETALGHNQELNIRLQEILVAKYEIMAREGEYQPRLGVGAGAGLDKVGEKTSQGAADEATGVPNPLANYRFGVMASWELDIWKKLHNAAKAAALRYMASIEGRNLIVTRLVAEIANSYYELLALDNQLVVLDRNLEIQQDALEAVKLQKQAGRVTQLGVQRFEAELLKNQSKRFDLAQQIIETENRINFLVGRYPQQVARDSTRLTDPLPEVIEAGIPSQLLDNRPDVRQAELALKAAKLDVKVAKARFYPSLSIEAGVGYEAFNAAHLVTTPESLFYNLAGNVTAPLLNRKAIKAEYYSASAEQLKAVYQYEQTLLRAFTDVANQLAMIENLKRSYQLEFQQVETLNRSVDVSNVLFQSARADYTEVLLTRRDALESQMDLIETRLRQKRAMVAVYTALGGGWR